MMSGGDVGGTVPMTRFREKSIGIVKAFMS